MATSINLKSKESVVNYVTAARVEARRYFNINVLEHEYKASAVFRPIIETYEINRPQNPSTWTKAITLLKQLSPSFRRKCIVTLNITNRIHQQINEMKNTQHNSLKRNLLTIAHLQLTIDHLRVNRIRDCWLSGLFTVGGVFCYIAKRQFTPSGTLMVLGGLLSFLNVLYRDDESKIRAGYALIGSEDEILFGYASTILNSNLRSYDDNLKFKTKAPTSGKSQSGIPEPLPMTILQTTPQVPISNTALVQPVPTTITYVPPQQIPGAAGVWPAPPPGGTPSAPFIDQ